MESDDERGRATDIFLRARSVELPDRASFLDEACAGDRELRREVESLLTHDGPGGERVSTNDPPPEIEGYRVLRKIGEGGMGEVWLARQDEPVQRDVAIKVIKAGMDTKQVIARFEVERQALALMEHPCIAKIFDAGSTSRGLPYFAMEYVRGEAITAYADRHRLGVRDRLELFVQVCEAIQHAHQKGVIHRDLKPSNVLVTLEGRRPMPCVIDFGVAKATAQRLTERSLFTEVGTLIGTPAYMSPEQAAMTGLDVDTRTDVYSLGVILYELLAGALPFSDSELRAAGYDEIRRKIREDQPATPSAKVSSLGEVSTATAGLRKQLRGDLDWITMRALEKDRTRRYQSPSDLAAEIERHLRNEPVLAGPPSVRYKIGKFTQRHRLGVAVGLVAILGILAFAATLARQAQRIARERNRAEQVSQFLVDLFSVADPDEALGRSITVREVLDRAAGRIELELKDQPDVQAQLYFTIGDVYGNLGLFNEAAALLEKSVAIRERALGSDDPATLNTKHRLGVTYQYIRRVPEAETLHREVLERQKRVLGEDHIDTLRSMTALAAAMNSLGRHAESETLYRDVLERQRRVLGPDHRLTLASLNNLGNALGAQGKAAEGEACYREALERQIRTLGPDHPHTLKTMGNVAECCRGRGDYAQAVKLHLEVLERRTRVLGERHRDTGISMYSIAEIECLRGRRDEALAWFRRAVDSGLTIDDEAEKARVLIPLHGDPEFEALAARAMVNGTVAP